MRVHLDFLAEGVRQPRESPHRHSHREVLTLDVRRADVLRVGLSGDRLHVAAQAFGRRCPFENLQGGTWSIWLLSRVRYSRSHSVTKSSSHLNRAIGIFKRTVRRQRSFGIHRSAADGALHPDRRGAYVVRSSLASRALGHGLQDVRRDVAARAGTDAPARPAARTREGPWSQPLARSNYNDLRRLPQDAPPSPAGLRTAGTLPTPAARPTSTGSANGRYPKRFLTQMYARFWNDLADHASA